ncbi:hypothetical protein P153DRAFT_346121 [Dothidotthia symphoricarpi CBS 119687]|uniref:Altered inheritance of mitochondria protein 6 n=1 Tax=Dothidotthia symphoricarpi CBS 119687 TaxID=1392245 RepID=A0A6A6A332_9PLEO|nr:uncharacterized protein P153DRAFT_346121 [Dothidotthia symphoricarpi CBS 119687]KAF2126422.1 hypothetical protein P153DRAFT_346121 [Dothidotthia symphoricarpi CBS 119687]
MSSDPISEPASPSKTPLLHMYHSYDHGLPVKSEPLITVTTLSSLENGDDYYNDVDTKKKPGFWRRMLMAVRRRRSVASRGNNLTNMTVGRGEKRVPKQPRSKKTYTAWGCLLAIFLVVFFFGLVHIANVILGYVSMLKDDRTPAHGRHRHDRWGTNDASYLLDITRDVIPIACHSHNDYWRRVPLYDALRWGCTGVEADVWLFDDDLFVGHNTHALTKDRTFRSMYVDPLAAMLDSKNTASAFSSASTNKSGVFDTAPAQTLVLLVDFKNNGANIFPVVSQQLTALREKGYLTYFNGTTTVKGPITVVATGNAPFDLVTANSTYRDIFFDAPLDRMYEEPTPLRDVSQEQDTDDDATSTPAIVTSGQGTVGTSPTSHFDATNSFYASVDFRRSIGYIWFGHISHHQVHTMRGQIQGAHKRGLKVRYWGAPQWPIGLRNRIWDVMVEEGVDYLNGDDLEAMTRLDWGAKRHTGWLGTQ